VRIMNRGARNLDASPATVDHAGLRTTTGHPTSARRSLLARPLQLMDLEASAFGLGIRSSAGGQLREPGIPDLVKGSTLIKRFWRRSGTWPTLAW
jgi:hypothetical protein